MDFGILGDKGCAAAALRKTGMMEEFERLGTANIKRFNELGIKTVLTSCAGCYGTMRVEYDELPVKKNFQVLHVAEY